MANPFSLQPLLEIMQERSDEATRRLGQLIAAEQNQKNRLQLLENYRAEYAQKMNDAVQAGISPLLLNNYREFLGRIDEALAQQRETLARSENDTRNGQEQWRQQNRQLKAIDTLAQRHDARERHAEGRRDQKTQDEFSARKYAKRDDD
ncbi:MAG: flagellar export protein FliJ [Azonexus sp.]|nr:flagellar export protein FliJ [Azonexus sp.]MCK6411293.1 flagellar export protein FliJ [Azonexus sp.]